MNIGSMEIRESKETNSKNDKNGRVLYLDYVKGISIILMLFSHSYPGYGPIKTWISAFHMPVFFVVCGFLVYMKNPEGISFSLCKKYLQNRCDNMLKPYLLFGALLTSFFCLLGYFSGNGWNLSVLRDFLTLQGVESMWFLPVYFYAEFLFLLSLKYIRIKLLGFVVTTIFTLFCCCEWLFPDGTFRQVKLVLIGFVFIYVGYMYAKYKICSRISFIPMLLLFVIFSIGPQVNGFASVYDMGTPLLFFLDAFGLSLVLLVLCRYLEQYCVRKQKLLIYFGVNSIIVLCTNNLLIEVIRLLDYKLTGGGYIWI